MHQPSDNTRVAYVYMFSLTNSYISVPKVCHDRLYTTFLKSITIRTPTRYRYHDEILTMFGKLPDNKKTFFISLLIFLLISTVNSSLKNPGPSSNTINEAHGLSIFYQNVQGLIPFTDLNKNHPKLDNTKFAELHAYIHEKNPDIIVLNETWLKNTILDEEIFPNNKYKIMRGDRTEGSHPPDLSNPEKFRRNGSGVLIAISCSLKVSYKNFDLNCKSEMLAVEIILNDGSKIVISTCYRVGTLGTFNYYEIANALQKLLRKKRLKKFFIVCD